MITAQADWHHLVEERTGIRLPAAQQPYLQQQIQQRMQELGYHNAESYYHYVVSGHQGTMEWLQLVERITIQATRFFRDEQAFAVIEQYLQQHIHLFRQQSCNIWSLGCASGEETYSLALLAQHILSPAAASFAVTGADIAKQALKKARYGHYPYNQLTQIPPRFHAQLNLNAAPGQFCFNAELTKRCCFSQLNIQQLADHPLRDQHIIFCQNVLLYFRRWRRREVLNELAQRLVPGGLLIIGLGEIVDYQHPLLKPIAAGQLSAFIRLAEPHQGRAHP